MADTNVHAHPPVEGDGVSYRGIVWFVVILVVTVAFCDLLVWGMFKLMGYQVDRGETARSALAAPALTVPASPNLLSLEVQNPGQAIADPDPKGLLSPDEPDNLKAFRAKEDAVLNNYRWVDQKAGVVEIPVDRAKALVLDPARKMFPTRATAGAPSKAAAPAAGVAPAAKKK